MKGLASLRESDQDRKESDRLVTDNLKLVHHIARMYEKDISSTKYQDLYSEGVLGLVDAAHKYTPGKAKFSTYAYTRVRGTILNYLQRHSQQIRVPKSVTDKGERIEITSLTPQKGEDQLQIDLPIVDECYSFLELLEDLKNVLTEKEYQIVMLKYEGYSQVDISKLLNLSENSISRTMSAVRQKLKDVIDLN